MGRTVKKKNAPVRKRFLYSLHTLQCAVEAVEKGMNLHRASIAFEVPYATLHNKVSGKSAVTSRHSGPESILGLDAENMLVEWLIGCAKMGFPISKDGLFDSVKKIIDKSKTESLFKNNRPGKTWFRNFMKRHPELTEKKAEYVNRARGSVTESKIRDWFNEVTLLLGPDVNVLSDPRRVFNMDESGFFLVPNGDKIIAPRGRHVYEESSSNDKENVTTLFAVNASGNFAPPLSLFKYVRLPSSLFEAAPKGWGIGKSPNGWMNSQCFFEYVSNVFLPFLQSSEIPLPVIIFLDGHTSHLSLELSEFCSSNKIILVALFPNSTHILQPLDVAVFGPMKRKWKAIVRQWRIDHEGMELKKQNVPTALSIFLNDPNMAKNIVSGFKCTGLFPYNADNVDYTKIVMRNEPQFSSTTNSDRSANDDVFLMSSYLKFIENNIDSQLLAEFKQTDEVGSEWKGKIESQHLYDFWRKIRQKDRIENYDQPLTFSDDDVVEASTDYPENVLNSNDSTTSHSIGSENNVQLTTNDPTTSHFMPQLCDSNISVTSDNEVPTPSPMKSVTEIIKDVVLWPKQIITNKRKRNVNHLPSVLTSTKWQEIKHAAENEKIEKERAKDEKKRLSDLKKKDVMESKKKKQQEKEEKKQTKQLKNQATRSRKKATGRSKRPSVEISSDETDEEWHSSGDSIMDIDSIFD